MLSTSSKIPTAQVRENICTDFSKPLYPPIQIGSSFWFSWLMEPDVKSFHYESDTGKFTARREERASSTNDYWYAYRKIKGKLRKVYLGVGTELTSDRLEQVAIEIGQSPQDYYYSRKGYTTSKEQNCVTESHSSGLELKSKSYPTSNLESCVTVKSELETLQAEVEQLRSQLLRANENCENLRRDRDRVEGALGELADKLRQKQKGYTSNSFSQGIKDLIMLAEKSGL